MKNYYFSYNNVTKHYYLDCGSFNRNREDLSVCNDFGNLERKLKKILPCHRKSLLIIDKNFPNQYKENLKNLFNKTQIKILFEHT